MWRGLLKHLVQGVSLGDFETIDLTLNLIGAKPELTTLADIARRVDGAQPRIEDLPD